MRVTGRAGRLTGRSTIWVTDTRTRAARRLFSTRVVADTIGLESPGPIRLLGWSGDSRWIVFTMDPGGSGSIAADGLIPRVLSAADGSVHRLPVMLPYPDYIAWCGGELVFTAGPRTLLFVRSQHGVGRLYASRDGRVLGPLLDLGALLGFYGHRDWWQTMDWSLGARPSA